MTAATEHDKFHNVGRRRRKKKKVFYSLWVLKWQRQLTKRHLHFSNAPVCVFTSTKRLLRALISPLITFLFVPLGAEGPVNLLFFCCCSCWELLPPVFCGKTSKPEGLILTSPVGWCIQGPLWQLRHYLPNSSTTDKPVEMAAARRALWGRGISGVCSRLISGPDAGGINKLQREDGGGGGVMVVAGSESSRPPPPPHLSSYSLTLSHSLSHSPLTLLINSTALRQTRHRNSLWLLTFLYEGSSFFLKKSNSLQILF